MNATHTTLPSLTLCAARLVGYWAVRLGYWAVRLQ